jgi:bifunctional non-homologous end joining protein LigD
MPKAGSSRAKPHRAQNPEGARHAFVGGWSQRRGDFVSLLLGVRRGRRRKLTYIGEVKTEPGTLAMTLLEPRLRESEVETSPFIEQPPEHPNHRHHWISPDLVAELEFNGWTRDRTLGKAALKAVADRPSFRHANWITPPK